MAPQPAPPTPPGDATSPDAVPPGDSDDGPIYPTRPPAPGHEALTTRFYERLADQSGLMDELARQMIAIELAVPGLYAAVLALLRGQDATLPATAPTAAAFTGWFVALLLTFAALFPRRYNVDPRVLRADPDAPPSAALGLIDFYTHATATKRRWLVAAALVFWLGLAMAVVGLWGAPGAP